MSITVNNQILPAKFLVKLDYMHNLRRAQFRNISHITTASRNGAR